MSIKHILGLDLGITSCGWAVTSYDSEGVQEAWLDDFGVRLFEEPADSKTKVSNASARRLARSSRRLSRRKKNRLNELKKLFESKKLISANEIDNFYNPSISKIYSTNLIGANKNKYFNPYEIRVRGLNEKLSPIEIAVAAIHITKHRGYENLFDQDKGEDSSLIEDNKEVDPIKDNYQFSIIEARKKVGFNKIAKSISKTVAELVIDAEEKSTKLVNSKNIINFRNNGRRTSASSSKESNYKFLFPREVFKIELKMILNKQAEFYNDIDKDFISKVCEISFRQRDFEDGFGPKEFKNLPYKEKIEKLQNKLTEISKDKSKFGLSKFIKDELKSFKQFKPFTELTGNCTFYKDEKRYIKSSLVFDIYQMAIEVSKFSSMFDDETDREKFNNIIFKKIFEDTKFVKGAKTEIKNILKKQFGFKQTELNQNKAFENVTGKLLGFLNKIIDAFGDDLYVKLMSSFEYKEHIFNELGENLNKNVTPRRRIESVKEWSKKNNIILTEDALNKISILPSYITTTSRLSKKAMCEVIEEFLRGKIAGLVQDEMAERNPLDLKIGKFLEPFKDPDICRNPVVYRALNETRKVLKALFKKYGEFEKINIETTRELGIGAKERNKININQRAGFDKNNLIRDFMSKNNIYDSFVNRLKVKLWFDQGGKCMYSLREIPIERIKSDALEVDHIIPKSIIPDDSYNNKVLVYSEENQQKGNLIPVEYIRKNHPERLIDYKKYVDFLYRKDSINYSKYESLKKEVLTQSDIEGFITRNLKDTSYITTYIRIWLQNNINMKFNKISKTVQAIKGTVTSNLRRFWFRNIAWGLDEKVREITPWHHAVDAIILSQFLNEGEITLAQDAIALKKIKEDKKRSEKEFEYDKNQILSKWEKNSGFIWQYQIPNAIQRLEKVINNKFLNIWPLVKDLSFVMEKRLPVVLEIKIIEEVGKINKVISLKEDSTSIEKAEEKTIVFKKRIPVFLRVMMPEEYMEYIKQFNFEGNIHYPCVSWMQSMRIRGDFRSSEMAKKQKPEYFEDGKLISKYKEKYIVDKKGTMWEAASYFGVALDLEDPQKNSQWIRRVDLQNKKSNLNFIENKTIIIKNDIVSYIDKNTNKKIYKFFRGKQSNQIYVNLINTTFISKHEKSKEIFNEQNYYGNLNDFKINFKIHNVNILGYLRF